MVYGLSVSPPKSATPAVSVPCRMLLELLVGRYGNPSLGCLDAMNREFALSDYRWPFAVGMSLIGFGVSIIL